MYSNSCSCCSFEREIIKIGQSSHKINRNKKQNFPETTLTLNACTKKSENLLNGLCIYLGSNIVFAESSANINIGKSGYGKLPII